MKILQIIILILILPTVLFAQKDILSTIPSIGAQIKDFIPEGYKELFKTQGDINGDGKQDVALIIFSEKEQKDTSVGIDRNGDSTKTIRDIKPTILITLLKENNGYKLLSKSPKAVSYWSINEMLMDAEYHAGARIKPLSIYKGGLSIYTYFRDNGWATIFKAEFKYINGNLFLIHTTNNYYHKIESCNKIKKSPGDYIDRDYMTCLEIYKTILQNNCKLTIERKQLKKQPLTELSNFNINLHKENFDN